MEIKETIKLTVVVFGSVSLGDYLETLMNFFVIFVCQGSAVRDLVITDSSVTDSVLVWPFQVSKDSNVSLRSKRSRTSEELPQSGFIKIGARAKIIKQDGWP